MMFSKLALMKRMNRAQRGFTLLEMLLALLIGGLIAGAITATIFQVVMGSGRTNNHMIAVRQVQSAGYWISHDALMAQNVELERDADGFPLTIECIDWDGTIFKVTYAIEGGDLRRYHGTNVTTVAKFVDPDPGKTKC